MKESFEIKGEYIELIKLLKATGLCETGGMAKIVTEDGMVLVDGEVETTKRKKLKRGQIVRFEKYEILIK
jgi:ribosome-associated protein